ncbi:MAG: hypothetical protein V4574_15805 [Pseudomonadota bacterium]
MTPFYIFLGLLSAACLFAWWRGGGPERAVAAIFLIAWLASLATSAPFPQRYHGVAYHTLVIDALLLLGLLAVSRRANRAWPVVVTSLQALIVLAHVARMASSHEIAFVYMVMTTSWPIFQIFILMAGTAFHWRRTVIRGAEPSWTSSLPSVAPPTIPPPPVS